MDYKKIAVLIALSIAVVGGASAEITDFNNEKGLEVTDNTDADAEIDKVQPIYYTCGDGSTTGTGDVEIDCSDVDNEDDIAFYDSNDDLLDYELESFDSDNGGVAWVYKSDWTRDNSEQVKIAYGDNADETDNQDVEGTWANTDAEMVQHLEEDPLSGTDSTNNDNDGTVEGASYISDGQFNGAGDFDGENDEINFDTIDEIEDKNELTVVSFAGLDESTSVNDDDNMALFGYGDDDAFDDYVWLGYQGDSASDPNKLVSNVEANGDNTQIESSSTYEAGDKFQLGLTYSDGTNKLYGNGEEEASDTAGSNTPTSTSDHKIGSNPVEAGEDNGWFWNGEIEAVRIYTSEKPSEWMQSDYEASDKGGQTFFSQTEAESTEDESNTKLEFSEDYNNTDVQRNTDLEDFSEWNIEKENESEETAEISYTFSYEDEDGTTVTESGISDVDVDLTEYSEGEEVNGTQDITMTDLPEDFWDGAVESEDDIRVTGDLVTLDDNDETVQAVGVEDDVYLNPQSESGIFEEALNNFYDSTLRSVIEGIQDLVNDIYDFIIDGVTFIVEAILYVILEIVQLFADGVGSFLTFVGNVVQYIAFYHIDIDYEYENESYDDFDEIEFGDSEYRNYIDIMTGEVELKKNKTQKDEFLDGDNSQFLEYNNREVLFTYDFRVLNSFVNESAVDDDLELDVQESDVEPDFDTGTIREVVYFNDEIVLRDDNGDLFVMSQEGEKIEEKEDYVYSGDLTGKIDGVDNRLYVAGDSNGEVKVLDEDYDEVGTYEVPFEDGVITDLKVDKDTGEAVVSGDERVARVNRDSDEVWLKEIAFDNDNAFVGAVTKDYVLAVKETGVNYGEFTVLDKNDGEELKTDDYIDIGDVWHRGHEHAQDNEVFISRRDGDIDHWDLDENEKVSDVDDTGDFDEVKATTNDMTDSIAYYDEVNWRLYDYERENLEDITSTQHADGDGNGGADLWAVNDEDFTVYETGLVEAGKERYELTAPLPKKLEENGLPWGTIGLISFLTWYLALGYSLLPDWMIDATEVVFNTVIRFVQVSVTILVTVGDVISFLFDEGFYYLKLGLYGLGAVKIVSWVKILNDDRYDTITKFELIYDDILELVDKAVRVIDTVYHMIWKVVDFVVVILRTLLSLIPTIG